jgi:hypothetical protein
VLTSRGFIQNYLHWPHVVPSKLLIQDFVCLKIDLEGAAGGYILNAVANITRNRET